jgi:DHA1 family inner membrane transport protein
VEQLTTARRVAALGALALGGFAVGLTEFVVMGLLPEMAHDLLPRQYANNSADAIATAGWAITVYALGVVAGAPTIAALSAKVARKRLVIGLLVLFVIGTTASALAPTFPLVLVARFIAGLPHGAYFGAAGILAAHLIGPGSQAKGFAAVLTGLAAANIFGVPAITGLGQSTSWRVAYLAIAAVFLLTLIAVAVTVPPIKASQSATIRTELRTFREPLVWLVAFTAAIGFGGFFAVYTYIAPITTRVAGLSPSAVPWTLVVAGLGMTVGIVLGGLAGDRDLRRSLIFGFAGVVVTIGLFGLIARWPAGLFAGVFLLCTASLFLGPSFQARLIAVAPDAQLMGAAINQSATNIANSVGAALGGVVIAAGLGYLSAAWVGVGLGLIGLTLTTLSFRVPIRPTPAKEAPITAMSST